MNLLLYIIPIVHICATMLYDKGSIQQRSISKHDSISHTQHDVPYHYVFVKNTQNYRKRIPEDTDESFRNQGKIYEIPTTFS